MTSKPLAVLFDAVHRDKLSFADFLTVDPAALRDARAFKGRQVYQARMPLRAYHLFLNSFLFEHLRINERVVYSYRRGATALQAVVAHAHSKAFYQTDITNFFGSITRAMVASTIRAQTDALPVSDISDRLDRVLDLVLVEGVLPLGFATSPPLSNAVLTDFDDAAEAYCSQRDVVYTRYADDLFFSGKSAEAMAGIPDEVDRLLATLFGGALVQNPIKRKLTRVGRKISFLGFVILPNGQVTLDRQLRQRIEVWLHYFVTNRAFLAGLAEAEEDDAIGKLSGLINYVNSVDKPYLDKLRKKFGATVVDSLLHRSVAP